MRKLRLLAIAVPVFAAAVLALATPAAPTATGPDGGVTMTQSQDGNTFFYTFTIATGTLQDFHLRPHAKGKKMKITSSSMTITHGTTTRNAGGSGGWSTPSGGTNDHADWHTSDDNGSEANGGTDDKDHVGANDPAVVGDTVTISVTRAAGGATGDLDFWLTNDGGSSPPSGPVTPGGTRSGPVAMTAITPGSTSPASGSTTAVAITSTEENTQWQAYVSLSLSETDPIGIDRNAIVPGANLSQTMGTFGPIPEDLLQLNVDPCVLPGTIFYMVLVGKDEFGEEQLWTEPVQFTVM